MGDRVLMQVYSDKENEIGPVVYCHWSGSSAPEMVRNLAKRMQGRESDVSYSTARLIQEAVQDADGNTGFGCWSANKKLIEKDTHGDAGIILIDADNGHKCQCIGGYLKTGADGFPLERKAA